MFLTTSWSKYGEKNGEAGNAAFWPDSYLAMLPFAASFVRLTL
jgi:hypothetical protein